MSWFQLDPQSIAGRVRAAGTAVPSLGESLARGIVGFSVLSVAGFVPWAAFGGWLHRAVGEAGMYVVCAVVFIALSAPLLHRLIAGAGSLCRFYKVFALSFTGYAAAWIIGWMSLHGHPGSLVGLFAGAVVMGGMLTLAFEATGMIIPVIIALFLPVAAGYFIGGVFGGMLIHHHALIAKLQWGLCFGVGFGAGLGLAFYLCQKRARALLEHAE